MHIGTKIEINMVTLKKKTKNQKTKPNQKNPMVFERLCREERWGSRDVSGDGS